MGETEKNADETAWKDSEISGRIIFSFDNEDEMKRKNRLTIGFLSFLCFVFVFLGNCIGLIAGTGQYLK